MNNGRCVVGIALFRQGLGSVAISTVASGHIQLGATPAPTKQRTKRTRVQHEPDSVGADLVPQRGKQQCELVCVTVVRERHRIYGPFGRQHLPLPTAPVVGSAITLRK